MLNRNGILSVQSQGSKFGVRSSEFGVQNSEFKVLRLSNPLQFSVFRYQSVGIRHLSFKIQSLELKPFSFLPPLRYPPPLCCGRQAVGEAFST